HVRRVLPAEHNILDRPQVTMVRYTSGVSRAAVVLFSTVPHQHLAGFLTMPPSTSVEGTALNDLSSAAALRAFASAGIEISHVALIRPQDVGSIVSTLGGVTVINHTAFSVATGEGTEVEFPAATLRLNGQQAGLFVEAATTNERLETASVDLLRGIVHGILTPSGVS